MKLKITSKFDLSDSVQYAQFRYFEDIGKLIADSGYDNINPFKYVLMDFIFETE